MQQGNHYQVLFSRHVQCSEFQIDESATGLEKELKNIKWHVLELSDVLRKCRQYYLKLISRNTLYYKGSQIERTGCSGLIMNMDIEKNSVELTVHPKELYKLLQKYKDKDESNPSLLSHCK